MKSTTVTQAQRDSSLTEKRLKFIKKLHTYVNMTSQISVNFSAFLKSSH